MSIDHFFFASSLESPRGKVDDLGLGQACKSASDEGLVGRVLLDVVVPVLLGLEFDDKDVCDAVL